MNSINALTTGASSRLLGKIIETPTGRRRPLRQQVNKPLSGDLGRAKVARDDADADPVGN